MDLNTTIPTRITLHVIPDDVKRRVRQRYIDGDKIKNIIHDEKIARGSLYNILKGDKKRNQPVKVKKVKGGGNNDVEHFINNIMSDVYDK
jgi:hypothetical protein